MGWNTPFVPSTVVEVYCFLVYPPSVVVLVLHSNLGRKVTGTSYHRGRCRVNVIRLL